jgi:hypothetical protein
MDVSWGALALALTVVGGALSWMAWRRRGLAAGLRGLAWSLLPIAAWLTGTLELVGDLAANVSSWALHLVFSPVVWTGFVLFGVSGVLFVVSGFLRGRAPEPDPSRRSARSAPRASGTRPIDRGDDIEGMDEIEAILKKHGI